MNCKHCNLDESKILYKGKFWNLSLHKQDYLGRCILSTIRHVDNFTKLTDEELIEFRTLLDLIEKTLKNLYGCTMLNWCCNMNNAVGRDEQPHVHIHIRPRYENKVNVNGTIYEDKEFGAHYDRNALVQFNEQTIQKIYNDFKKALQNE